MTKEFEKGDYSEWLNYVSWGKVYTNVMTRALPLNLAEYKQNLSIGEVRKSDYNANTFCLVPIVDFVNHRFISRETKPATLHVHNGTFSILSPDTYTPSQEITI